MLSVFQNVTWLDDLAVLGFALIYPVYTYITYPKARQRMAANHSGARVRKYLETIIALLLLTAFAIFAWANRAQGMNNVGLVIHDDFRFGVIAALTGLFLIILVIQWVNVWKKRVAGQPLPKLRISTPELLPHTRMELLTFLLVAVTAGICEELLFRGVLVDYIAGFSGMFAAIVVSVLIFGLAHIYQGVTGVASATILGGIFALMVWISGSLWPSIILHTFIDITAGIVGWATLTSVNNNF